MVTAQLIGHKVTDGVRIGILTDVISDWVDPASPIGDRRAQTKAFVRPVRGGVEWSADPAELEPA